MQQKQWLTYGKGIGASVIIALALLWGQQALAEPEAAEEALAVEKNPDPWEGFNRKMFAFDMQLDRYALKPVAKGYRKVTPSWGQKMVSHFFANLRDVRSAINALLQARPGQAGSNLSRVLVNTTLGVGGLFDVASDAGLKRYEQDFGLTLARWGVRQGPYLVLPVFGPSTVRDTTGMVPDIYTWPPHYLRNDYARYGLYALNAVQRRASVLELEKRIVGDKYLFVRDYYLQSRAHAAGEEVEDDFGADLDDSDWDSDDDW